MPLTRLDQEIVKRKLVETRELGKRLILAGKVKVNGHIVDKASEKIKPDDEIELKESPKYVSRGGFKLEHALNEFKIDPEKMICLDIGASTGGFTDCLLQQNAQKVYAYDTGTNQLSWKIRSDPRVISREKFNCRNLKREDIGEEVDLIVIDVSFISLTKILPAAYNVLRPQGSFVTLIKPQFELSREEISKGGIVKDTQLHEKAVSSIVNFATIDLHLTHQNTVNSPITGMSGNIEFLAHFIKT
ncbi:MAG: TlyA family RNA methyltransferase [Verrucomicrobiota bacterium]|nr:TlyA family RNA methyltransferase [Verrucomicrobiota bacterium]